jgi:hypothetical protein
MQQFAWHEPTRRRRLCYALAAGLAVWSIASARLAPAADPVATPVYSVEEGRRLIRMMNDIYLAGVLTTHSMYVQEPGVPAAVTWAKQIFAKVRGKGWPEAHIFATHDRPLNPDNTPDGPFERNAVRAFQGGKPGIEMLDGQTLRFATPIHITDASCMKCHVRNRVGDLVGGVSYRVPVHNSR